MPAAATGNLKAGERNFIAASCAELLAHAWRRQAQRLAASFCRKKKPIPSLNIANNVRG